MTTRPLPGTWITCTSYRKKQSCMRWQRNSTISTSLVMMRAIEWMVDFQEKLQVGAEVLFKPLTHPNCGTAFLFNLCIALSRLHQGTRGKGNWALGLLMLLQQTATSTGTASVCANPDGALRIVVDKAQHRNDTPFQSMERMLLSGVPGPIHIIAQQLAERCQNRSLLGDERRCTRWSGREQ